MLPRFGRYAKYRDSGVEWLGHIPAHWEVRRLKACATVQLSNVDKKSREGESEVLLCNYVDVYYNERIEGDMTFMAATATPDQIRRFSLRKGDVLVTKDSETWTDIAVPALVDEDLSGVLCGYHLALIRPGSRVSGGFLARTLSAVGPRDQFHVAANGITRFGLTADAIRGGVIALPPLEEQRAIAAFLDRETGRIDALVAKKRELIRQLREKRIALISHAVTKGLDPDAPTRDSGAEWLGDTPAHWNSRRLKTLSKMRSGESITSASIESAGRYPVYGGNGLRGYTSSYTHDGEHVLVGRQGAHCGNVHIARRRFWASEHAVVVTLDEGSVFEWFASLLEAMNLNRQSMAAAQPGLAVEQLRDLRVSVPPVSEQGAIAEFLDRETGRIDGLIAKVEEGIERLREYRTTVISAAVTGQIDVRSGRDGSMVADVEAGRVNA